MFDRADKKLLGVHIIGERATELVHIGQAVMHFGGHIDDFIDRSSTSRRWARCTSTPPTTVFQQLSGRTLEASTGRTG